MSQASYEVRGVFEWADEEGNHREVVVRDTKHHLYRTFEINANADPHSEAAEHLKVGKEDIELPEHVKRGLESSTR